MKDFIPAILIGLTAVSSGLLAAPDAEAQIADGQGSWTMKAPMPGGPRAEFPGGTVNGKIYVFGGGARGIGYDIARTEEYDLASDRWRTRAPMPRGLNHVGAVVMDGKIYAAGGFGGSAHKDPDNAFLSYDPANDNWQALTPLPSKRGAVAVAAVDGKIHVIGGREGDEPLITTHNVYDPATRTWSVAAPLLRARDHMVAMTVEGRIHVIGGRYSVGDEDMTGLHEVYDPKTNSWTQAAAMPTPRGGVVGALYRGLIFVMGAEDGMRTYDENEAYDAKTDRWFKLKPLPMRLHAFAAAAGGNDLYIMGGAKVSGSLEVIDQTYSFSLP
jgi:N-acetylneuraminic acid mutarotase